MRVNGITREDNMNLYQCEDCKTKYNSEVRSCKIKCPKCGSKNHRLLQIRVKNFKF